MDWKTASAKKINTTLVNFKSAMLVYLYKPQVINRLLFGAIVEDNVPCTKSFPENNLDTKNILDSIIKSSDLCYRRQLLYRDKADALTIEAVIFAEDFSVCYFVPIHSSNTLRKSSPAFCYAFRWQPSSLYLNIIADNGIDCTWVCSVLFPKICHWSTIACNFSRKTLCHINPKLYFLTYCELKEKYSKILRDNWCESTDCSKFIYEDLGIAAYLINFWKQYNNFGSSFIDIGCGNGLLVYILSMEGYNGAGVDMCKRKIWNFLGRECTLFEETVLLNDTNYWHKLSKYTWLVSNHGDEMTPWIPFVASKLGCNFITIPCCPYTFDGKFTSRRDNESIYQSYQCFIKDISLDLGFKVFVDDLRIPSSRNTCIIGTRSAGSAYTEPIVLSVLSKYGGSANLPVFIDKKRLVIKKPVRMSGELLSTIFNLLLSSGVEKRTVTYKGNIWDIGGSRTFNEIYQGLPKSQLQEIKNLAGGLKTCLKCAVIFEVNPPNVRLKDFTQLKSKRLNKLCLYVLHPKGCPFDPGDCPFIHE